MAVKSTSRVEISDLVGPLSGLVSPTTQKAIIDALRASGLLGQSDEGFDGRRTAASAHVTDGSDVPQSEDATAVKPGSALAGTREAVVDFQKEADRLGIPLGPAPTDEEARERLLVVAADATDIFATPELALACLTTQPLDSRDRTGMEILRDKGLTGVLAGLDHKRFGSRG